MWPLKDGGAYIMACLKVVLNDAYNISVFDQIWVFCRNQRGLNRNEYEPQVLRETIVHPA